MALPRVPVYPSPDIDPSKVSLAFGDRALPKLNRELKSDEAKVREKAVFALSDVMHKPESITAAIREGIPESLHSLLKDPQWVIRAKAAQVLSIIVSHSVGRMCVLEGGMVPTLANTFSDEHYEVRYYAHSVVEMISRLKTGALEVVRRNLVPLLVEKVRTEENADLQTLILDTIHWCFVVDTEQGLGCEAMAVLSKLLHHQLPEIRGKAARNIMELSFPLEGKNQACKVGCIPHLVSLLGDNDSSVRARAAGAIMSIAVTTEGKFAAYNCQVLDHLQPLLQDGFSEVQLNTVKCMTLIAEVPQARRDLQDVVPKLEALYEASENISRAAHRAVQTIIWRP
jgi:hypothetical protein